MSYAKGTEHYNLPLTKDTDVRTWDDTNDAFTAIDTAIFNANSGGYTLEKINVISSNLTTVFADGLTDKIISLLPDKLTASFIGVHVVSGGDYYLEAGYMHIMPCVGVQSKTNIMFQFSNWSLYVYADDKTVKLRINNNDEADVNFTGEIYFAHM